MRGDRVLVRGYKGEGRICRVLVIRDDVIELTDEQGFAAIERGEHGPTVLFRSTDVFAYDGEARNGSFPRWETCNHYTEKVLHQVSR